MQHIDHEQDLDQEERRNPRRILLIPYVPGISDKLRTVARRYELPVWYSYPGKLGDGFSSVYKDSTHPSKIRHAVYEAICSCGQRYVGKSY